MRKRAEPVAEVEVAAPIEVSTRKRMYTRGELVEQLTFVENGIAQGVAPTTLEREFKRRFSTGKHRFDVIRERVIQQWSEAEAERATTNRAAAVRRIMRRMAHLDGMLTPKDREGNPLPPPKTPAALHQALAKWEEVLAKLQGSFAPVTIALDVRVSQSVVGVIANLTPEQVQEYVDAHAETERMATAYKAMLGNGTPGIR